MSLLCLSLYVPQFPCIAQILTCPCIELSLILSTHAPCLEAVAAKHPQENVVVSLKKRKPNPKTFEIPSSVFTGEGHFTSST